AARDPERPRLLVEEVVLGEAAVRRPLRNLGRGDRQRVEDHHRARRAAQALVFLGDERLREMKVILPRFGLDEEALALRRVERDELRGKLRGLRAGKMRSADSKEHEE